MKKKHTPWVWPPVHPEAEKLPMASDAEIKEMSDDIFENGLKVPVDVWVDNREEANGSPGPFPEYLMDGRNRREALKLLGHDSPLEVNTNGVRYHYAVKRRGKNWVIDCDPVKFILSANVYRRQLSAEQKREVIRRLLKADPLASNRELGKKLRVSHHTVAAVRDEAVRNGQIAQSEQPLEHARTTLRENPDQTVRELAKNAGVGLGTAQKAMKAMKLAVAGSNPEPQPETKSQPEPINAEREIEKKAERFRATVQKTFTTWAKEWLDEIGLDAMTETIIDEGGAWSARYRVS